MIIHHPFQYSLGWFQLTGFGLAVLFAFWIAQISSAHILAERGKDPEVTSDVLFGAVVGGLLGAKIYYAILRGDWHELFQRAGFVFWGGLIGGIIASWIVIRYKGWKFTTISDAAAPGIAAAYAIGRSGCWAVGDDYGRPWNSHWAVQFPEGAPPSTAINMVQEFHVKLPPNVTPMDVLAVYPTQLFEVTMGFIMFLILWRLRNHKHAEGWLFGLYCVMAGIERFIVEFFRAKDDRFFGPFTTAQVIALLFAAGGVAWMYLRRNPTQVLPLEPIPAAPTRQA
ncbi:MAG TPA: prolipoprotein diacylglyceryl transferase family protein [Gemmatimonadaceae bacterium]|nr:prolipoprotein diacylglyceryl transferase family protein [Gemmatimonadaceae bacterium]